ncbi:MAG: hypothetical protein AAF849_09275 [Bacteroidota bacterium]
MKKRFSFLSSLLFFSILIYGQDQTTDRTVVYYEDGSVFIGKLLREDDRFIHLILATSDTIAINKGFVKRSRHAQNVMIYQKGKFHFTKGIFATFSYGGGFSFDHSTNETDLIVGTRLNSKYAVGAGIGIHSHSRTFGDFNWNIDNFIPLYLYGRYYPWNSRVKLFADLKTGFGFSGDNTAFGNEHTGGFMLEPGIGLNFAARRNFRFLLSLNQIIQNTSGTDFSFDRFGNQVEIDYRIWYNRTVFKLMVEFR